MSSPAAAKIVLAALKKAYKADRANAYSLPKSVKFFFRGITPTWHGTYYSFVPTHKISDWTGDEGTIVTLKSYGHLDASGRVINDGATFAPDFIPGAKEGAALHDPGHLEMDAIANKWKHEPYAPGPEWGRDRISRRFAKPTWTRADVRQMMDDFLGDAMVTSGAGWFARLYHSTVRTFGGLFHDIKKCFKVAVLTLAFGALLTGCTSCQSIPDVVDWIEGLPDPVKVSPETPPDTSPDFPISSDAVPYSSLNWRIARTRPSVSSPAVIARIRARSYNASELTFSWDDAAAAGRALGSSTHDPAELRAYIFFGGEGGFFDWCSITRSQRDFHNVNGGLTEWNKLSKAGRPIVFFIGSKDGRSRTNIIAFE